MTDCHISGKGKSNLDFEWTEKSILAITHWLTIIGSGFRQNGCSDALVADWWSAAFFAYLLFAFYLPLADLSMGSIPAPANQTTF